MDFKLLSHTYIGLTYHPWLNAVVVLDPIEQLRVVYAHQNAIERLTGLRARVDGEGPFLGFYGSSRPDNLNNIIHRVLFNNRVRYSDHEF